MKILILGATGFIGSEIIRRLAVDGHSVTGLARNLASARRKYPFAEWVAADLAQMNRADEWRDLLDTHEAVVNCAGALQDGPRDDLSATQKLAMLALYNACKLAGGRLIIQISARTSGVASDLPFLRTKKQADDALVESGLPYVILRPALVVGRNAHGGTALLRALASVPYVTPLVHAGSPVQTVALDDVATAVSLAINGEIASGTDLHLASEQPLTLRELISLHRRWLGLDEARPLSLPAWMANPVSWAADIVGRLGWRSPLRSTAMAVMSEGVTAEVRTDILPFQTAAQTLAGNPAGIQDLWFARLYLLKPLIIACLSVFWTLSGFVPLLDLDLAASHFLPFMPVSVAIGLTVATCLLDILLGLAILIRAHARKALFGMLIVTASYLVGGSLLEPSLWLDPLGPLVKVLPSILLTLAALAILDER